MEMTEIVGDEVEYIDIRVKVVNARLIIISPTNPSYETYEDSDVKFLEKKIISLNIDGVEFSTNGIYKFNKQRYRINNIRKLTSEYGEGYHLYTQELTNSYYFKY